MGHCKIFGFEPHNIHSPYAMKRFSNLIALASVALSLSGVTHAQTKPDLAGGAAKAAVCMACHTADGSRGSAANPILAGQHPEYIVKQLVEFKEGKRKNAVMNGMAANLSQQDMVDIAAFYASKKPVPGQARDAASIKLGESIWRGGIAKKGVPACAACHSPNGAGIPAQYPRLGGQHYDYTKAQLVAFRQGERNNNAQMTAIAANLSDKEIHAVSDFIAGLR